MKALEIILELLISCIIFILSIIFGSIFIILKTFMDYIKQTFDTPKLMKTIKKSKYKN